MRLISYNIHKGFGGVDRRYQLQRIIDVLRHEQADLICLQEVDRNCQRSRFDDQPDILADRLQAHAHAYQLNHPHREGGYGNLLLSRWPIRSAIDLSLRYHRRKNRAAQLVVIDTPSGSLHLINWHLGLAEKERRWQASYLLQHPLFRQSLHLPTLVAGDFNDWRNTLGANHFRAERFEQVTAPVKHFRSFPAFYPLASLDKIFFHGAVRIERVSIIRHRLARQASDHLPLCLDFGLDGQTTHPPREEQPRF